MTTALIADAHLNPGDRYKPPCELTKYDRVVFAGDMVNLVPWGWHRWDTMEGWQTIASVVFQANKPIFIAGNHDPYNWLSRLCDAYGVPCARSLDIGPYHISHGHEFAGDWAILCRVVPRLVDWLSTGPLRDRYYAFCRDRGWMATGWPHSEERLELFESITMGLAARDADRHKRINVIGHLHVASEWDNLITLGCNEVVELEGE